MIAYDGNPPNPESQSRYDEPAYASSKRSRVCEWRNKATTRSHTLGRARWRREFILLVHGTNPAHHQRCIRICRKAKSQKETICRYDEWRQAITCHHPKLEANQMLIRQGANAPRSEKRVLKLKCRLRSCVTASMLSSPENEDRKKNKCRYDEAHVAPRSENKRK